MKIRIVIVHDDEHEITLLKRILLQEGYGIVAIPLEQNVFKSVMQSTPDLVLLDTSELEPNHLEVVEQLRLSDKQFPIVVLTKHRSSQNIIKFFEAGIDDCIMQPLPSQELAVRIKALLRRSRPMHHEVLRYGDIELDTLTRIVHRGIHDIELSPTEYELLVLFLHRPHHVLTHEMILHSVWGTDFIGTTAVIGVYVGYLRAKLEAHGEARIIHTIRGVGYVLKEKGK